MKIRTRITGYDEEDEGIALYTVQVVDAQASQPFLLTFYNLKDDDIDSIIAGLYNLTADLSLLTKEEAEAFVDQFSKGPDDVLPRKGKP